MNKLNNRIGHRLCLFLALVGMMSGVVLADYPWQHSAFAQAAMSQTPSPGWNFTGSLNTPRGGHTATLLPNGKVMVVGGAGCGAGVLKSTEIYDPATKTWSYSGDLVGLKRSFHTATLLPNGKVLVAGGAYDWVQVELDEVPIPTNTAELYDPAAGTWSPAGSLNSARVYHTATLLANGKVLVAGGYSDDWWSAEIYDPDTGRWSYTNSHGTIGSRHAVLLQDGAVMLLGYIPNTENLAPRLYDPARGIWRSTSSPKTIRYPHTITLLPNGKVLAIGSGALIFDMSAEIYDPAGGTWSSVAAPSFFAEGGAILLPNGKVLIFQFRPQYAAELYDPATGRWSSTTGPISGGGTPTLLSDGNVLFTIGACSNPPSGGAMLYDYRLAPSGTVSSVSAASYSLMGLASESIAVAFGDGLATSSSAASTFPLPTQLAGTSVKIKDSAGDERLAPLFFVSPTQINYQIPAGTAPGMAALTITNSDGLVSSGVAIIRVVAPGLFTANADGQGVVAAIALRVKADGSQSYEPVAQFDAAQNRFVPRPLDLGPEGDQVYLLLFGTGIRNRSSLSGVFARIGDVGAEVSFAGAQGDFTGLDQINVLVPRSLAGRGEVYIQMSVLGAPRPANRTQVSIK